METKLIATIQHANNISKLCRIYKKDGKYMMSGIKRPSNSVKYYHHYMDVIEAIKKIIIDHHEIIANFVVIYSGNFIVCLENVRI